MTRPINQDYWSEQDWLDHQRECLKDLMVELLNKYYDKDDKFDDKCNTKEVLDDMLRINALVQGNEDIDIYDENGFLKDLDCDYNDEEEFRYGY